MKPIKTSGAMLTDIKHEVSIEDALTHACVINAYNYYISKELNAN